jgi:hypothetical protein
MKPVSYIRIFLIGLLVTLGLAFYSINRTSQSPNPELTDGETYDLMQSQSEFVIWESLSRNLLGIDP